MTELEHTIFDNNISEEGLYTRKRWSSIWNHYIDVTENRNDLFKHAMCKYCFIEKSFLNGSTTNLFRHLKAQHSSIFESMQIDPSLVLDGSEDNVVQDEVKQKSDSKRTPTSIFTMSEKAILIMLAKKYNQSIECRSHTQNKQRVKSNAWLKIEREFNRLSNEGYARDQKMLRKKYDNMKLRVKEKYMALLRKGVDPMKSLNSIEIEVIHIVDGLDQKCVRTSSKVAKNFDDLPMDTEGSNNDDIKSIVTPTGDSFVIIERLDETNSMEDIHSIHADFVSDIKMESGVSQTQEPVAVKQEVFDPSEIVANDWNGNPPDLLRHSLEPEESDASQDCKQISEQVTSHQHPKFRKLLKRGLRKSKNPVNRSLLKTKMKYFQVKHQCLLIEHRQTLRFQAVEHDEKLKVFKLQQELLRKQIELEDRKIREAV